MEIYLNKLKTAINMKLDKNPNASLEEVKQHIKQHQTDLTKNEYFDFFLETFHILESLERKQM